MRVGIFGGTFSPPHNGHLAAARAFLEECALDRLYIVPAGIPPHKEADGSASNEERFDMAVLAFRPISEKVYVSETEFARPGKSYTVDTLRWFYEDRGFEDLYLYCGTDMFLTLDTWREPETLFRLATVAHACRYKDAQTTEIATKAAQYREKYHAKIAHLTAPPLPLSSSDVRAVLARGEDASALVPPAVLDYIKEHGLYGQTK